MTEFLSNKDMKELLLISRDIHAVAAQLQVEKKITMFEAIAIVSSALRRVDSDASDAYTEDIASAIDFLRKSIT